MSAVFSSDTIPVSFVTVCCTTVTALRMSSRQELIMQYGGWFNKGWSMYQNFKYTQFQNGSLR